jgi:ankyrin repeat protein
VTPLHLVCTSRAAAAPAVLQALLAAGAHPEGATEDGLQPLHFAARTNEVRHVRALLEGGAGPDCCDCHGYSPLHFASQKPDAASLATVEALLARGATPDTADALMRQTPLHVAANHGCVEVIRRLVEAGADATARDNMKATPLHLAARAGHAEAVRALAAAGQGRIDIDAKV